MGTQFFYFFVNPSKSVVSVLSLRLRSSRSLQLDSAGKTPWSISNVNHSICRVAWYQGPPTWPHKTETQMVLSKLVKEIKWLRGAVWWLQSLSVAQSWVWEGTGLDHKSRFGEKFRKVQTHRNQGSGDGYKGGCQHNYILQSSRNEGENDLYPGQW